MLILRQIVKEFWLPLLISIGWTIFNFKDYELGRLQAKDVINVFGPTFFLASWVLAQLFRVKNQQHVRSGLTTIEQRISSLDEQISERVRIEKELLLAANARRLHEGSPKFQSIQNDRFPDTFFSDSDSLRQPYFSWISNFGRTVYDVKLTIKGAKLQMIQGGNRSDYDLHIPVWASDQLFRIVWTYDNDSPSSRSVLTINYTDTFGFSGFSEFHIELTQSLDIDGRSILQIVEHLASGASQVHSGKQNFGYDYAKHDARRDLESELKEISSKAAKIKKRSEKGIKTMANY